MTLWQGCRRRVGLRRRRCSKTRSCHAPSWCGAIVLPTPATGGARTHEHAGAPSAPAWEMQPAKGQQARERASTGPMHACIQAPLLRPCMYMHVHVPGKQARIITSTYLKTSTSGAPSKCPISSCPHGSASIGGTVHLEDHLDHDELPRHRLGPAHATMHLQSTATMTTTLFETDEA
jgi:hypothetical protein